MNSETPLMNFATAKLSRPPAWPSDRFARTLAAICAANNTVREAYLVTVAESWEHPAELTLVLIGDFQSEVFAVHNILRPMEAALAELRCPLVLAALSYSDPAASRFRDQHSTERVYQCSTPHEGTA